MVALGKTSLRSRVGRVLRGRLRRLHWFGEYRRLRALHGIGTGRRAFLIGNGPSISAMNLMPLAGEFVCIVNMGIRALPHPLPRADMHVVLDSNRYNRFADEIETLAAMHGIRIRIMARRARHDWKAHAKGRRPYFLYCRSGELKEGVDILNVRDALVTGTSVLPASAILLEYLGFSPIYVIGCDLDYDTAGAYFYPMGTQDEVHERDPKVIARRLEMVHVNSEFATVRSALERKGVTIFNAGLGGNLATLPRVDFSDLFPPENVQNR